jgi:hypothetical protein
MLESCNLLSGLGVVNLMLGSIVLFSRDKTALMILVIPLAPSELPFEVVSMLDGAEKMGRTKLGFTDPM